MIKAADLKAWVTEARSLCLEHGRAEIGDQKIGQILATAPGGDDGVWPCGPVREVLEDVASQEIAIGMGIAVYNSRGFHRRSEDGADERALAAKYHTWSRQLAALYPAFLSADGLDPADRPGLLAGRSWPDPPPHRNRELSCGSTMSTLIFLPPPGMSAGPGTAASQDPGRRELRKPNAFSGCSGAGGKHATLPIKTLVTEPGRVNR